MSTRETAGTAFSLFHDLFQRKGLRKGRSRFWSANFCVSESRATEIVWLLFSLLLCCLACPSTAFFIFPKSDGRLCYSPAIGCLRAEPAPSDHSTASVWWIRISPADSKVSISAWVKGDIWWHICQEADPDETKIGGWETRAEEWTITCCCPFFEANKCGNRLLL